MSKKVTLDKDQKYTICYSFKNKMGISANNFVILELIKDGSIMYTRKLQATEATTFDYTAPATGEYTWRMRSSSIGTTTTQPITYSLDNLSIFYSYPYTVENCDNLADGYRFGFNGKESDKEIDGQQDYGFRIYDSRIGRFKSVDPLTSDYPYLTPYAFAENDVIRCIDLDGLEKVALSGDVPKEQYYKKGDPNTTYYTPLHAEQFKKQTELLNTKYGFNTIQKVYTGREVLNALISETAKAGEITNLALFAHGGVGLNNGSAVAGLFYSNNNGLYTSKLGSLASIEELASNVQSGLIKFSANAKIFIDACNTSSTSVSVNGATQNFTSFAESLCMATGATVIGCDGHMEQKTPGTADGKFKISSKEPNGAFYKYTRVEEKYNDNGTEKTKFTVKKESIGREVDMKNYAQ